MAGQGKRTRTRAGKGTVIGKGMRTGMGREEGDWHRDGNKHGDCDGDRDMDKDRDSDSTCSRNQSRRSGVKSNCSLSSTAGKEKHGETWL